MPSSAVNESPILSLTKVNVPDFENWALCNVNFKSSVWTGVQAVLFCDLNKLPKCGCSETILFVPLTSTSPIWEIHAL